VMRNFQRLSENKGFPKIGYLFTCEISLTIIFLLLMACACWAFEEKTDVTEYTMEELMNVQVYGASKFDQKIIEAPSSVSIVSSDDIKKYGYRTLAEILRSLRSFLVTNDRNYSFIGVRGFGRTGDYNSHILIVIDGHRINDNVFDSVLVGNEFILDVDLIDRVEVIRGPGSSLYGNNAFFAVINIITRSGRDLKSAELSGSAGSYDTYKGRLSLGHRFENGLDIIASGSILDSKGQNLFFREFDNPADNNGIAKDCDFERNHTLFSKLSFHDFTLEATHVSRTKGIPTASFGTDFNDPRNRTTDEQSYVDLKYEHQFENELSVLARLRYDRYHYDGTYVFSKVLNQDIAEGEWWGGEVVVNKEMLQKHHITAGAEYQFNTKQEQRNYNESPYSLYLDDKRNSKKWALYIQDEFKILDNLILNAGVRYDHYDTFGETTNPRLALIYKPFERSIFKFLYGTAFRAPNVYELYYETPAGEQKSNPDLKPEKIKTYELVYEQYFGNNFRMTTAAFYNKVTQLISQYIDPVDGQLVFKNADEVEAKGFEFELEIQMESGIQGRLSYTFQKTEDALTGNALVNSPKHLAKFNIIVPLFQDKLFVGMEEQYASKRKTLSGKNIDHSLVTNLTLFSQNLTKGLEMSASIYNLFDKKNGDPAGEEHRQDVIEQDGRSFRVKITYAF
jgi:outer membrane receptor for ferrienterochelin and colicins